MRVHASGVPAVLVGLIVLVVVLFVLLLLLKLFIMLLPIIVIIIAALWLWNKFGKEKGNDRVIDAEFKRKK